MKTQGPPRRFLIATTALVLVALAVPPVAGQYLPPCSFFGTSNMSLSGTTSDPIEPGNQTTVPIEWEYYAPLTAFSLTPVTIWFSAAGEPAWSEVALSSKNAFVEAPPAEETHHTGVIEVTIALHEDALQGEAWTMYLQAESEEGTCVARSTAEAHIMFRVAGEPDAEGAQDDDSEDPGDLSAEAAIPGIPAVIASTAIIAALAIRRKRDL